MPIVPLDSYQQQPMSLPSMSATIPSQIDQEFTQINQQFQSLNLQYQNQSYEYAPQSPETNPINNFNSNVDYQQTDYNGQSQQQNDLSGGNTVGYPEQQIQPQMYAQQSFNDPTAFGATNYHNTEVIKSTNSFIQIMLICKNQIRA